MYLIVAIVMLRECWRFYNVHVHLGSLAQEHSLVSEKLATISPQT
jgi:hypothetical protein